MIQARHYNKCFLPNGDAGWCVNLGNKNRVHHGGLSPQGIAEIRLWLSESLGMTETEINESVYLWGVTFAHEDQALLCYIRFK